MESKEKAEENPPRIADDGADIDLDAAAVEAAAVIEEMSDCSPSAPEGEPPVAGDTAGAAPSDPFRGAAWHSPFASLPDTPMSPTGLGDGGLKREAPPAQPSSSAKQLSKDTQGCGHYRPGDLGSHPEMGRV